MKTLKIVEVLVNTDTTEGRGPMRVLARFSSITEADKVVDDPRFSRWCVMGYHRPGQNKTAVRPEEYPVYDTAEEFWETHDEVEIRRQALAKLTERERKVLGLT